LHASNHHGDVSAVARWQSAAVGVVVYSAAIAAVWCWRRGVIVAPDQAAWLVPLTWIVAALLPTRLLSPPSRDLFSRAQWIGEPHVTVRALLIASLIILPLFSLVYLFYYGWWRGAPIAPSLPDRWGGMALFQFLYVGFPEELFFRGYLQQRFDDAFGRPHRCCRAAWGPGLPLANLFFATGHLVVTGDVRRLAVFFPGLVFGWLQARTDALLAPMLFHGMCNITLLTLQAWTVP